MIALVVAVVAAAGVHLVWSALALGWSGFGAGPAVPGGRPRRRPPVRRWLAEAGLGEIAPVEFLGASFGVGVLGGLVAYAVFGGVGPVLLAVAGAAVAPGLAYRNRRRTRRERAQEAWPRLIEEIRILTGSVGRSIPQALFEAARRAPEELQPAFAAAHREWVLTTDFGRTTAVLKAALGDPTADAACETLLVAHEAGGADLDRRLEALAEDRIQDLQGRMDARAEQAGVRFARRFVLIVPLGMAVAGMSVGNGRSAYREFTGQVAVVIGLALVAACWLWAGRLMRLPDEQRVFDA